MQEVKPTNAEEKTVLAEENDAAAADSVRYILRKPEERRYFPGVSPLKQLSGFFQAVEKAR